MGLGSIVCLCFQYICKLHTPGAEDYGLNLNAQEGPPESGPIPDPLCHERQRLRRGPAYLQINDAHAFPSCQLAAGA